MNPGQNKFLIGLGVAVALGCGGLGFLIWQSYSKYSETGEQYSQQVTELKRLQSLPLYPEQSNLDKLDEQKQEAVAAAASFQKELVPLSFPLDPMTPEQFQDSLRASVSAVVDKATKAGVKLPDHFYLGFDVYQSQLPKAEAAAALGRQLKAIELAVNTLIQDKVDSIGQINRPALPEESDKPAPTKSSVPGHPATGKPAANALLTKYPFDVPFTAEQASFRRALNDLSKTQQQFFIPVVLNIKNQVEKGPSRADTAAPAAAPAPAEGALPTAAEAKPEMKYIVGTEKLNVALRLNMVVFASPSSK
jgi:hypothetical protein